MGAHFGKVEVGGAAYFEPCIARLKIEEPHQVVPLTMCHNWRPGSHVLRVPPLAAPALFIVMNKERSHSGWAFVGLQGC